MKRIGFTLIELLIVVAIIAILAAIAVPNFLEAQTRAKVARVYADLRTLGGAVEAYAIEWNRPPLYIRWIHGPLVRQYGIAYILKRLTTPIAYLSSLPIRDPFQLRGAYDYFEFYGGATKNPYWEFKPGQDMHGYWFRSHGPDRLKGQKLGEVLSLLYTWEYHETNYPPSLWYDSTNGTVSDGDIIRTRSITDNKPAGIKEK